MIRFLVICCLVFLSALLTAQVVQDSTENNRFVIKQSDNLVQNHLNDIELDSLSGNVILQRDSIFLFCDTVILQDKREAFAYGNVVIFHSDSTQIFCDSLRFLGDSDKAILKNNVVLKRGDELLHTELMDYYLDTERAVFNAGVTMDKGTTKIRSKRGFYNAQTGVATFFRDVQVQDSLVSLRTDSLAYNSHSGRSNFYGPSEIIRESAKVYTEEGYYNIKTKYALFDKNPQYINGLEKATASRIFLDGKAEEFQLEGDAIFSKDDQLAMGDQIIFNEQTEEMRITGDASFRDSENSIRAAAIIYDGKSEAFATLGGGQITNGSSIIDALDIANDPVTNNRIASGDVIWRDTVNNSTLICDQLVMDDESNEYIATSTGDQLPILLQVNDGDTLFLVSERFRFWDEAVQLDSVTQDTLHNFKGLGQVSILNNDFSAISDSLRYSDQDSSIYLFDNSFIWPDSLQLTGDSVQIQLQNNQIERLWVYEKPFVVIESDSILLDQMKGKTLEAFFEAGKIDSLVIDANAESIYFVKDDIGAFIGMNKTEAGLLYLQFKTEELYRINFKNNPKNTFRSISKVQPQDTKLSGYSWQPKLKPTRRDFYLRINDKLFF